MLEDVRLPIFNASMEGYNVITIVEGKAGDPEMIAGFPRSIGLHPEIFSSPSGICSLQNFNEFRIGCLPSTLLAEGHIPFLSAGGVLDAPDEKDCYRFVVKIIMTTSDTTLLNELCLEKESLSYHASLNEVIC